MKFRANRNGEMIVFNIRRIAEAIRVASEAVQNADHEIKRFSEGLYLGGLDDEQKEEILAILRETKHEAKRQRRKLVQKMNCLLQIAWLHRNHSANRGDTSAVSDLMLLTIPTPPTAEAADRSLWQRGMTCEAAA